MIMEKIKYIWYDNSIINNVELEQRLQSLQISFIRISKNNLLVRTELSSHALYDSLGSVIEKKSIFIGGFDTTDYWGYLDGDIWKWINP